MNALNMTTWMPTTTLADFLHYLSTGKDPHGLIAEDVVAEMNFPHTSFTVSGKHDFDALRAQVSDRDWVLRVEPADPTPDGFVVVVEYDAHQGDTVTTFRTISAVTISGGHVTRLRHWCTGALG